LPNPVEVRGRHNGRVIAASAAKPARMIHSQAMARGMRGCLSGSGKNFLTTHEFQFGGAVQIKSIFSGLMSLTPGINAINAMIKQSRGQRRELLRELQNNINQISVYIESGEEPERIDRVIAALQVSCYEAASKAGFDFNSLKKDRVASSLTKDIPQFKAYSGFTTEQLFDKLYTWIHRLKIIVKDYPSSPKFRKRVRLINVWKLMLLLVKHINA
jgi:hypothetical protein